MTTSENARDLTDIGFDGLGFELGDFLLDLFEDGTHWVLRLKGWEEDWVK